MSPEPEITMPDELRPLHDGILAVVDSNGKVKATLEEMKVDMTKLQEAAKSTEDWQQEIEKKMAKKRGSYMTPSSDNLLQVIPERDRDIVQVAHMAAMQNKAHARAIASGQHHETGVFNDDPVAKAAWAIWLRNHLHSILPNKSDSNRYAEEQAKLSSFMTVTRADLGEDTPTIGGNLVPTIVEGEILRLIADNGVLRPLVRKVPMTTKTHAWPTRAQAFTAQLLAEGVGAADSSPAAPFGQEPLTAKKFAGFATASMELLADNVVGLADYLATEFSEQIARLEDQQALEGTGAGGNFTGVLTATGVVEIDSGTNGDQIFFSKLMDTIYGDTAVAAGNKEQNAIMNSQMFMASKLWSQIVRQRASAIAAADQEGQSLFAPASGIGGRVLPSVHGFPIHAHSGILVDRTEGTGNSRTNIYFGPPNTIIFGDLLGFEVDLNPWAKFNSYEIDIRGMKRTGILVGVPTAWSMYTKIDPVLPMLP